MNACNLVIDKMQARVIIDIIILLSIIIGDKVQPGKIVHE